jgi:hypothetical protein
LAEDDPPSVAVAVLIEIVIEIVDPSAEAKMVYA